MLDHILYYIDERGRNPVKEFIHGLSLKEQAKVYAYIHELARQGHNLRRPMADYLRSGIYELRPKHNRIFYFFFVDHRIVLVHAIRKDTGRILENDLSLCLKRKQAVESDEYPRLEKLED